MAEEQKVGITKVILVVDVTYEPGTFVEVRSPNKAGVLDFNDFANLVASRLQTMCGDLTVEDVAAFTVEAFLAEHAEGRINRGVPTGMTHGEWAKTRFLEELKSEGPEIP